MRDEYTQAVRHADLAYVDEDERRSALETLNCESVVHLDDRLTDTQGYVAEFPNRVVIAFRGTEVFKQTQRQWWQVHKFLQFSDDVQIDLDTRLFEWERDCVEKVHRGFYRACDSIIDDVFDALDDLDLTSRPIHIVGHSLGAAIAALVALRLVEGKYFPNYVHLFGCPKVGNREFASYYNSKLYAQTLRFEHCCDVVTRVPFYNYPVGQLAYIDSAKHVHLPYQDPVSNQFKDGSSAWFRVLDRAVARMDNIGTYPTRGLKDHPLREYANATF